MAKAKPTRKAPASASSSASSPAKKAGAKASSAIDTTLAVESAAAMVGQRNVPASASAGPRKESAAFRQLKAGLNQSHELAIGNLLDKSGVPTGKRSSQPFDQGKGQISHNQTFGADVSRASVPRRTGG